LINFFSLFIRGFKVRVLSFKYLPDKKSGVFKEYKRDLFPGGIFVQIKFSKRENRFNKNKVVYPERSFNISYEVDIKV
jgi:hypothetical protein